MSTVDVATVSRVMGQVLARDGRPILYQDRATGETLTIAPMAAASPTCLLPALVVAAELIWRETTGKGFSLTIVRDPQSVFGYRLDCIGSGSFTTVMLAAMEATAQIARSDALVVNDLSALWRVANEPLEQGAREQPTMRTSGAAP